MKPKTPQISWHGRDPIFSIDFHPSGRVATAGADNDVKVKGYLYFAEVLRYGNTNQILLQMEEVVSPFSLHLIDMYKQ